MAVTDRTTLKTFFETGDVPTQSQFEALLDSVQIFDRYVATVLQGGVANPVVTVLENTLSGPIVWVRAGAGGYIGTLVGAFPAGKVATYVSGSSNTVDNVISLDRTSDDTVVLNTTNGAAFADSILNNTTIRIDVYP